MLIRLVVIFGLLIQPLLVVAGMESCRSAGQMAGGPEGGCCATETLCCMLGVDPEGGCEPVGMACRCGVPEPEQPKSVPGRGVELSTILPRLLAMTFDVPRPSAMRMQALPAAFSPRGMELRAFLCVWLT